MSRSPSVSESHVKVKKNLEFLDALLADLQNTAGLSTSYGAQTNPVNGSASTESGLSSGTPNHVQSAVTKPKRQIHLQDGKGNQPADISDLDDLLDGLKSNHGGQVQDNGTNGVTKLTTENGETDEKDGDDIFQKSTILSSKVEALLDELDSAVTPAPHAQAMPKPVPMKANIADVTPIPRTASSATKELDDLMASLSDFKVNPKQPPPVAAKPDRTGGDMQSKTADYAKLNKQNSQKGSIKQAQPKGNQLDSMLGNLQSDMSRQGVTMVTKGTCAACNKPIIGQVCTALGKAWHPEHFTCTVCEVALGTRTFFERDGKPYCETDYHEQFAPKCGYCGGPIFDSCVTAMDNTWHPEHFVCAQCGKQFGESGYHEKDGKPYCRDDYFNLFAPKCSGCNQAILDNYISALNGHWHPECFVCMECHQPFQGGSFFEHEGMPYCEMHYHARRGSLCYSCQKPITGRCITAMHRKFHPEHFICAFCLKQLNKGTFKEQNDKPYCHPCFVKLFG